MSNNLMTKEASDLKKKALLSMLHNKLERQEENFDKEDEIILKKRHVEEANIDQNENNQIAAESEISSNPILNREEESENNNKLEEKAEEVLNMNRESFIEQNIQMEESNENIQKESEQEENLEPSTNIIMNENEIQSTNPFENINTEANTNINTNINTSIETDTNLESNTNINIISSTPIEPTMMDIDQEAQKNENKPPTSVENKTEGIEPNPVNQPVEILRVDTLQQDEPKLTREIPTSSSVIQTENLQEEKKPPVSADSIPTPIKEEPHQPKKITFMSAKKEVDEFVLFIDKVEQDIKNKYGINLSEFNYEDILPEELKLKLVEEFFNSKEIIDLAKNIK